MTEDGKLVCLVLCEESQETTKALRGLGEIAYSCDIVPCSGGFPEWHIKGDCTPLLNGLPQDFITQDGKRHHITGKADLIIAHPPCTYLTTAGACRLYHKDKSIGISTLDKSRYNLGLQARDFFLSCLNANCDHVAVENPTPMRVYNLPKESQVVHPWMFGDDYTKRTCIWLRGLPLLIQEVEEAPEDVTCWVRGGTKDANGQRRKNIGIRGQGKVRSKTFPGFARAWAEQWTKYLHGLTNNTTTIIKDF